MGMQTDTTPTATEPTAGAPTPDAYAEFSAIFEEITGDTHENAPKTDTSDNPAGTADNGAEPAQSADGGNGAGEPAPAGSDPAPADAAGSQGDTGGVPAGDAPSGTQPQPVDWQAKFNELQSQLERLQQQQAPAPAPAAEPPAEEPRPIYSAEEIAELQDLQKEWPEVARLVKLLARQQQHDTLTYAFSEMERVLTPLQSSVGTLSTNDHMGAIYEAHPDYDQVYQPVMDWIGQQPTFLQSAYQNVVKQGTAQDVVDMIARFKSETKWQAPQQAAGGSQPTQPAPASTAPAPAKPAELSEAAKQAAKAIGAVGTKRGGSPTAQDPLDFDAAWDEATATPK